MKPSLKNIEIVPRVREYGKDERVQKVGRIGARAPSVLRSHLDAVAASLTLGYRTKTQLISEGMVKFLQLRPWDTALHGDKAFAFRTSGRVGGGTVDASVYLEPTEVDGRMTSGQVLLKRVQAAAAEAGVSDATFAVTYLWWLATVEHPSDNPKVRAALLSDTPETAEATIHRRATYANKEEKKENVARLGTRAPAMLRNYMRIVADRPDSGFASMAHLFTVGMHQFLEAKPWARGKDPIAWRGSKADGPGTDYVVVPILLQTLAYKKKTVTGPKLLEEVKAAATKAEVSGATFALTFLWWLAEEVFPPAGDDKSLLKALPTEAPDKRFTKFRGNPLATAE